MTADNHTHTRFSPDSEANPEDMILRAVRLGLKQITVTDHCDPLHPEGLFGMRDTREYVRTLSALKHKYAKDIYVCIGLEIGYMPNATEIASRLATSDGIEYVIDSVHVCGGSDCYDPHHFEGKTRDEAYAEYFETVRQSLDVPYPYHAVGHVGYIERKAKYADAHITYANCRQWLDPIFDTMIEREKILELNTNVPAPLFSLPSPEVVEAYYKRGGRLVAFSSDAHTPERVADGLDKAERILRDIGFKAVSAMRDGKRVEYKL